MALRTKTELKSEISSRYADNAVGAIGSDDIQTVSDDTVDSLFHEYDGYTVSYTGVLDGGVLSVSADDSEFDLTAGFGWVVDNTTDVDSPARTVVSWPNFSGVSVTNISTEPTTYIGIDASGSIVQQANDFTPSQRRDIIRIGRLAHFNNANISAALSLTATAYSPSAAGVDVGVALGAINCFGNKIYPVDGTLQIRKTAGECFRIGINYGEDKTAPNTVSSPEINPITFSYLYDDGAGNPVLIPDQTQIDPTLYDDGSGTLQNVGNARHSIQRVFFYPGSNTVVVSYGKQRENSFVEAKANLAYEEVPDYEFLQGALWRCSILAQGNSDDLSDVTDVVFAHVEREGR